MPIAQSVALPAQNGGGGQSNDMMQQMMMMQMMSNQQAQNSAMITAAVRFISGSLRVVYGRSARF